MSRIQLKNCPFCGEKPVKFDKGILCKNCRTFIRLTKCNCGNIYYQTSEIGRVDQGGGGTIAYILGNYNMNVIDAGIAVLNMHAPMEIVSKVDVYEAYKAYIEFISKL